MDMYTECGRLRKNIRRSAFDKMEYNEAISWQAMIMGCALHGHACDAILLKKMLIGVEPNFI